MANTNCFLDYAGLELFWSKVKDVIENNELVTANAITNLDTRIDNLESTKSDIGHTHDDRYYTESEINDLLNTKSNTNHTHTFSSLTSKPTTISGYGITDALTTSNYTSYTVKKDGTGASGNWGINISGNAATATNADYATSAGSAPASDVYSWAKQSTKPSYSFSEITSKPTTLAGYGITDAASKDHTHNFYIGTTKVQSSSSSQNLTGINTLNANKIAVEGTDSPKSLNITGEAVTLVDNNLMGYHAIDSEGSTFYYGGGEEVFRHTTTSFDYENTGMGISTKLIIPKKNGTIATKEDTEDLVSIPFTNPVGGWCPDPCFWKGDDGYFYIKGTGRLVTVKRTRDFVNYEDTGRIFISTEAQNKLFDLYGHYATNDSKYKLHPNYWAPFVIKIGDNWVLYQAIIERTGTKTNAVDGTAHIVAFTSKTPYGNFSNPVTIVSDNEITAAYDSSTKWNNIIDPFVYCDPFDNHIYLLAGSSYAIRRKRLSDDGLSMYKDGSTLAVDNYAMHVAGQSIKTDPSRATVYEGAYLYNKIGKWGNYWYLFVSSGSYDSRDYCVKVGRCPSTNYHIGGTSNINFYDKASHNMRVGGGTTILSTESESSNFWGPGHIGGIFETEDGKTWMLYHCHDGNGSQDRKLFIQELLWDEDGWPYFENNGHPISNGRISKHIITSTNDVYYKKGITEITWSSLKSLRDNGNLIPGMQYRITDYTCTTSQANTRSAGHVFDIIVTADSTNTLNEVARAVKHVGDTHFNTCDLNAWKIWYCLDNDNTRFAWADVVASTIEMFENGITCTYAGTTVINGTIYYLWDDAGAMLAGSYAATANRNPAEGDEILQISANKTTIEQNNIDKISGVTYSEGPNGRGVIYRMIDEHNNDCPYDFKNIQYNGSWGYWAYTFNWINDNSDNTCEDLSVDARMSNSGDPYAYNNIIKPCDVVDAGINHGGSLRLNACVFLNTESNDEGVFYSCRNNTFGNDCYSNTFGNDCYSNTFGDSCYNNTFGDSSCYFNTFGDSCYNNTFVYSCSYNTFGNNCYSNTFGGSCIYNTFGSNCYSNTFGEMCYYNTFGSSCFSNTFGDNCDSNTFGNGYCSNTFGDYCYSNTFGNHCEVIKFVTAATGSTPAHYFCYNNIDSGVSNVKLYNAATASSTQQVQYYHIVAGVKGTSSTYKNIRVDRGRTYDTTVSKVDGAEDIVGYNLAMYALANGYAEPLG